MPNKLTKVQKEEIVYKYISSNISGYELGRQYGVHGDTINAFLKRKLVKIRNNQSQIQRRYTLNENYFNQINSEDKAYFLGLLYSDGYNNEKRGCIEISLQEQDRHILDKFKVCLDCNSPLSFRNKNSQNVNWKNQYRLSLYSKKISKDLSNLGCKNKKSLTLVFPKVTQVPYQFLNHFLRGVFDGDGCLSITKNNRHSRLCFRVRLTSSVYFCRSLKSKLKKILSINSSITKHLNNNITKELSVGGNIQALKFLDWLYRDATIYLNRKYHKYQQMKLYYKNEKNG